MTRHLGKAITILAMHNVRESITHADIAAYHAPGEWHRIVAKGEPRRYRAARRLAKSVSGLSRTAFNREMKRLPQRAFHKVEAILHAKHDPFCLQ